MAERRDTGWDDGLREAFAERRRRREARGAPSRPAARPGRFERLGEIARDETSVLLRARDRELDREVALRAVGLGVAFDADEARRLFERAQVGAQLQHPGIVPVYAFGLLEDGRAYVVRRLVEGESLADMIARETGSHRLLAILEQAANALAFAHARGVAHGRMTAERIVVGPHGEVLLTGWDRAVRTNGETAPVDEDVRVLLSLIRSATSGNEVDLGDRPRHAGEVACALGAHLAEEEASARLAELDAARARARASEEKARDDRERTRSRLARAARRRVAGLAVLGLLAAAIAAVSLVWRTREDRESAAGVQTRVAAALREAARHEAAREWATARAWAVNAVALACDDAPLASRGVAMRDTIDAAEADARARQKLDEEDAALLDRLALVRQRHEQNACMVLTKGELRVRRTFRLVRPATLHAGYEAAFRDAGFEVLVGPEAAVDEQLRRRPRAIELATALDAWSGVAPEEAARRRLLALAAAIDPDESRREIREAWIRGEIGGLARRALLTDASTAPAAWLGNLGWALRRAGDTTAAAAILREAAARYSGDRYLRKKLGHVLGELGQNSAAVVHFGAERALAPHAAMPLTDLASALWIQGQRDRAIELQRRATTLEPDCATSWGSLAGFLVSEERFDEAAVAARRALSILPGFPLAHHNLGVALLGQRDHRGAIESLRRAAEGGCDDGVTLSLLGWALFCDGQAEEAIGPLRRAVKLDPEDPVNLITLSSVLGDLGRLEEARLALEQAIRLDENRAMAHTQLGQVLRNLGRHEEAVREHRRAIEIEPALGYHHDRLAVTLIEIGNADAAIAEHERAVAVEPGSAAFRANLGRTLLMTDRVARAEIELRKALEIDPSTAEAHCSLGQALMRRGRLPEACSSLRRAIELDPEHPVVHSNLGLALRRLGRLPEAVAELRRAVDLDSSNAVHWADLGATLGEAGETRAAEDACRRAIGLDEEQVGAWSSLGVALGQQNRVDEAEAALRRALELDPDSPLDHLNLGALLCDVRRDPVGAEREFRTAIALDPELAVAHHFLGNALHAQGRYTGAVVAQENAVRLEPANEAHRAGLGAALASRGAILCQEGRHREAIEALRRATRRCPRSAVIHSDFGTALMLSGDLDGAVTAYRKSLALGSRDFHIHHNFATALTVLGGHEEAIAVLRETVALSPATDARAPNALAWLLANAPDTALRRPQEAVRFARVALERAPGWRPALNTLGAALHRAGRHEDAIRVLGESVRHADGDEPETRWTRAVDGLFLSMAHARLGNAEEARTWYARSARRLAEDAPPEKHAAEELERFRAEAETLLADIEEAKEDVERKTEEGR